MNISMALVCAISICTAIPVALSQDYPNKPVRLIVPFPPGGGTDTLARAIAPNVSERLGQPVVIDNRGGGGAGMIGSEIAVRSKPDGYTLLIVSGTYAATPALHKLPYDPVRDIEPIILATEVGLLLASHPGVPATNVKELIAYAKGNPGKLNFGSIGNGSFSHLAAEFFSLQAKVKLTHVPYRGMGPALTDLIAGQIQLTFGAVYSAMPHVKAKRLRAIAVTTAERTRALPDVPTVAETMPSYVVVSFYGILGPKHIPKEIVMRLNREVDSAMRTEEVSKRLQGEGLEIVGGPPSRFLTSIRRDIDLWMKVVTEAKITVAD